MAWSSSSSTSFGSTAPKKFDVFLSFRGDDTRNNFTSHLHAALRRWKIQTYMDHNLQRGDEISDKLHKAIQGSKLAIVIFSENYAASRWCLDELVKIIECKETNGQILWPIFYHTEPSDVRYQKGSYAEAFAKHELYFGNNKEKLDSWRDALTKAANHSGLHILEYRKEAEIVEEIAQEVSLRLLSKQLEPEQPDEDIWSRVWKRSPEEQHHEDISQPAWKKSLGKTLRVIKQHAKASLNLKLKKGESPSVDGNVEYKV